jgi:hypothetical protein
MLVTRAFSFQKLDDTHWRAIGLDHFHLQSGHSDLMQPPQAGAWSGLCLADAKHMHDLATHLKAAFDKELKTTLPANFVEAFEKGLADGVEDVRATIIAADPHVIPEGVKQRCAVLKWATSAPPKRPGSPAPLTKPIAVVTADPIAAVNSVMGGSGGGAASVGGATGRQSPNATATGRQSPGPSTATGRQSPGPVLAASRQSPGPGGSTATGRQSPGPVLAASRQSPGPVAPNPLKNKSK